MEAKNEVKGRIQEKAEELFMQYGIRSVSMDDIAAQLGMSKKTLYQYFNDKDKLRLNPRLHHHGKKQRTGRRGRYCG